MSEYVDPYLMARDGGITANAIPRAELLFIDRAAIKEAADRENAAILANPEQAEIAEPSVVATRTGELAVVATVGIDNKYL